MTAQMLWCCLVLVATINLSDRVAGAGDFRYLTGYADLNQTGAHYQFTDYTPDLGVVLMDNTIESVCEAGFWILYDTPNYGSNNTGLSYRYTEVSWCGNTPTYFRNMTSSLRYAGSPNGLNDNYYNLYEGTDYRGREFKGNTNASDVGDLDMAVSSLVVTGQSAWTFYTGLHYTGANVCVYAFIHFTHDGIDLDSAYYKNMDELGLPDNSIRSVARGCLSERVLGHPGGERGGQDASS